MINGIVEELLKSAEMKSMEHLAALRVAISICESEDVQHMIGRFSKTNGNASVGFLDGQWKRLCGKARRKLDQIGVPELIIDIIIEKIWPISFEVCKWIICHAEDTGIDDSSNFFWTPHVSIDYEKTAKMLTKNETLDIKNRFKLACFYCLELEVRSLWETMSLSEKRYFFVRGNLKKSDSNPIVLYWTYYIQEAPIEHWGSKTLNYTQLFKYAVENGYLYATKFFLGKLKIQLRNRMISNSFSIYLCKLYKPNFILKGSHFAIAYFLISELGNYRGISSFNMVRLTLRHFLEWPLQKYFMTVVDRFRHQIRESIYGELLEAVFEKDLGGFKDYDYKKLFMEFWLQSPRKYKTYVNTDSRVGSTVFIKFIKKHFGFVFDENSFAFKSKFRAIVFQREISEDVAYYEKEDLEFFKFLIRERVIIKSSLERLVNHRFTYFPFEEFDTSFYNLPLGELLYLIDGILGIV